MSLPLRYLKLDVTIIAVKQMERMQADPIFVQNGNKQKKLKDQNKNFNFYDDKHFYDFEVILKEIGCLGKYQLFLFLIVFWISIPSGFFFF